MVSDDQIRGLPSALHKEAKAHPGGWVYEIAAPFQHRDAIPPEAVKRAWKVDDSGTISGESVENEQFDDATTTSLLAIGVVTGVPTPASQLIREGVAAFTGAMRARGADRGEGELGLNVVLHVPTPDFVPDFEGLALVRHDSVSNRILLYVAVPTGVTFGGVSSFLRQTMQALGSVVGQYVSIHLPGCNEGHVLGLLADLSTAD